MNSSIKLGLDTTTSIIMLTCTDHDSYMLGIVTIATAKIINVFDMDSHVKFNSTVTE